MNFTLQRFQHSKFRQKFCLTDQDKAYVLRLGLKKIEDHAYDFIRQRLAPAFPARDGKQTPFQGHPVFKAQHATATCCRGCLAKWHHIPPGHALTTAQITYVVEWIMLWITTQMGLAPLPPSPRPQDAPTIPDQGEFPS